MSSASVNAGDTVRVHFEGRLPDGTVFASTKDADPIEFIAGGEEVLPGVSQAVVGMSVGDRKTVTLHPGDAYGDREDGLQQTVDRSQLPDDVQVGDRLVANVGEREIPVWVARMSDDEAVVDANHPLAGETVVFDIELKEIVAG